jgi:hypothetical protein
MDQKENEKKEVISCNGDKQKEKWEKPDIHLYPIQHTLNGLGTNPGDLGLNS